jgi:hypothetical protein
MVHSEIGDVTWPSRRVEREFGKANSYWQQGWQSCYLAEGRRPPLTAAPIITMEMAFLRQGMLPFRWSEKKD